MYSIMIVDDEKTIRETLPQAVNFEQHGFRVCATARNGEDALEKTGQFQPDVVLLDVCMPVLDGLGYLKKLHESGGATLPYVVMLSGYSDFEYARTAMRYGVKAYLTKPLDEDDIAQILSELKKELDRKSQERGGEMLLRATEALQKMYHGGDGERAPYRDYFLMHCIVLKAEAKMDVYASVRACLEERIPGDRAAFFRNRGSLFSYLVSRKVLEEYQYSVTLFARHLLYHMKKCGMECALLFDERLFRASEGTFRSDHDIHLYRMMTDVFWKEGYIIQNEDFRENDGAEMGLEQEDVFLAELKKAIANSDETGLKEICHKIGDEIERKRPDIAYIQKISYRIYYALTDLLQDEGEETAEPVLKPLDWREASCFIQFEEWKDALWKQISSVFSLIDNRNKEKLPGTGEMVISYIREHFREQISLKDVADRLYVSPAYLGRCVQRATGVSFRQYVTDLRIEEAKRLLKQTDKLIYEIAEEVGFKESKYFASKFMAEVGKTPLEYRKLSKKDAEG